MGITLLACQHGTRVVDPFASNEKPTLSRDAIAQEQVRLALRQTAAAVRDDRESVHRDVLVWSALGFAQLNDGAPDDAMVSFRSALSIDPSNCRMLDAFRLAYRTTWDGIGVAYQLRERPLPADAEPAHSSACDLDDHTWRRHGRHLIGASD